MVQVLEQWIYRHTRNNEDVLSPSIDIMVEKYFFRFLGENGSIVDLMKRNKNATGYA